MSSAAFDLQPHLVGEVVALSPMLESDWPAQFAIAADPQMWAVHPAHDRWQKPVFRAYFDDNLASGGALTIRERATGVVIGHSRYDLRLVEPGEIEIGGTFLARRCWGGTVNRAVKALMIAHALTGFDRVVFYIGETNIRSRRAMEKIGGRLLPDRRVEFAMSGVPTSHVVYAIDAPLP